MKKFLVTISLLLVLQTLCHAQFTRYIIYFTNKDATTHTLNNPSAYLSQRAIDRRTRYSIQIDSTDLPVPPSYITQVKNVPNVTLLNVSKWLNAVTIQTTDASAITAINALSFVKKTSTIAARAGVTTNKEEEWHPVSMESQRMQDMQGDFFNYGSSSFNEIHLHKGEFLHNIGLRGQGMQIAMLDGGYLDYTTLDAMDSMIANNQVLSTWDFVNREASVVEDNEHGMQCLSTIVANIPGVFVGKAPKASFHLFRTEDGATEYPIEEFNWVCGAERADSAGTDIVSSSLGYNTFDNAAFDHTYNDMNGDITIAATGADLAARKGILVFNAQGNDGIASWHYLATPADGDSVVAVGAVNKDGVIWAGSSYGPSFDGRIKPDVASIGLSALIQTRFNTIAAGNGTSFACPNMAGLATCLWQGFPEVNNMRIVRALREAGNIFNSPDDRTGYGVPDMKKAFIRLLDEFATDSIGITACTVTLKWKTKDVSAMKFEIERKLPGESSYTKIAAIDPQAGNILATHTYEFTNLLSNANTGAVSYVIRQILDTSAANLTVFVIDTANIPLTSSCTTTATTDPSGSNNEIIVLPNPTSGNAKLTIKTANAISNMPVLIYNMKGQEVMRLTQSKGPGTAVIDLSTQSLANGRYIIKIYNKQKLLGSAALIRL